MAVSTALVAIVLTGLNLRIAIVSVGPLVDQIQDSTGMSSALAGLLTTIPFFFMGVSVFFAGPLLQRVGPRAVIMLGLGSLIAGCLLRSASDQSLLVVLGTVPIGIGIALMGLGLPAAVKLAAPERAGMATGAYVAALSLGVGIVGLTVVPLSSLAGGWRLALVLIASPALLALAAWLLRASGSGRRGRLDEAGAEAPSVRLSQISRPVLLVTLVFGLQSFCFAAVINWAPVALIDSGFSAHTAALSTALIGLLNVIGSLIIPRISDRRGRRLWIAATLCAQGAGIIGLGLLAKQAGLFWPALFGVGSGASFALLLTLPIDLGETVSDVAAISMWMMGLGYTIASAAPWLVGALRDSELGLTFALVVTGLIGLASAIISLGIPDRRQGDLPAPIAG